MQQLLRSDKSLSILDRLAISRHSKRPKGLDVIESITSSFEILHGDRLNGDDKAVICGIGEIGSRRCVIIAQHKGSDLKERTECNYGMMSPNGYRKALRVMTLAERFSLPVVTIIDTSGAYPGLSAEKEGQSRAIAENLFHISGLKTPIVSLLLGEGSSGGALGIGICDRMLMLENAYYSVITPEGCASILWKDAKKKNLSSEQLKMQSEDLLRFGMIDEIIKEGEGGFHENIPSVLNEIKRRLEKNLDELSLSPIDKLIAHRSKKYRSF